MLEIFVEKDDVYLSHENRFVDVPSCTLKLEHSLISVAKWESLWGIPYLTAERRTFKQEQDYIRCMVVGPIKNDLVFSILSQENIEQIRKYINHPMTATTFSKPPPQSAKKEVVTAEILYYRMFTHNIPIECQKWHLNRLLTLLRVCDLKNSPPQKMNKRQTAAYYAEQNALRRAKYKTRG